MKTAEEKLKEAIDLIDECRLQIEYLHGKFKKTGTSESVLARIYAFYGSYAKPDTPDIDNDSLTKDFREWLGWNDQLAPDPDDEDYYTYSWGLNVWCNAYKAYKQALSLPTLNRDKVMGILQEQLIELDVSDKTIHLRFDDVADALCSLSLPTESEKKAIKNFTDKLANQEDIHLDIIDIVNENFWDLLPDKHPKDKPTLSEGEIDELTKEFLEKFTTWRWDMYEDAAMMNERVRPIDIVEWFKAALKELTKPKEER
jgi:hypothetical protein